jgi:hypothetical protein
LEASSASQSVFAASNSSFLSVYGFGVFVSGGSEGAFAYRLVMSSICLDDCPPEHMNLDGKDDRWKKQRVPLGENNESSGAFSIGANYDSTGVPPPGQS